jgi:glycosyltransferase involved in cell wall biosynthesis
MTLLSIITVVRNDYEALLITEKSIIKQRLSGANFEWIIIDGSSSDETINYFSTSVNSNVTVFVSEPDNGIYDAMNKGIRLSKGLGLLFLNAGDYFVGEVLVKLKSENFPCYLNVKFTNYFGKLRKRKIVNERFGISNGHQGIIFERAKNVFYDIEYKICADYKYFLDHGYTSKLGLINVEGYVYWNQGLSLQNWKLRDKEIFKIRKEYFGIITALVFELKSYFKRILRIFIFRNK